MVGSPYREISLPVACRGLNLSAVTPTMVRPASEPGPRTALARGIGVLTAQATSARGRPSPARDSESPRRLRTGTRRGARLLAGNLKGQAALSGLRLALGPQWQRAKHDPMRPRRYGPSAALVSLRVRPRRGPMFGRGSLTLHSPVSHGPAEPLIVSDAQTAPTPCQWPA